MTDIGAILKLAEGLEWRPLPTGNAGEVIRVLLDAMLSAKEQNHIYEAAADIEIALQRPAAIAKGER